MTTGFYGIDHPNPNAPRRDNGLRGWYYPERRRCHHGIDGPHLIVVHTSEQLPDYGPDPDENAAKLNGYGSRTDRTASWHVAADADSWEPFLPDDYTAFHVRDYNRCGLGLELATQARAWADAERTDPAWVEGILRQGAFVVAVWSRMHAIPLDHLTRAEVDRGGRGLIGHAKLDPSRRSDPGDGFPWARLLNYAQRTAMELGRYKMLVYAEGRDVSTATGAVGAFRTGVATADLDEAKAAEGRGEKVIAVGGPAIIALGWSWAKQGQVTTRGHRVAVFGDTGGESYRLLGDVLEA